MGSNTTTTEYLNLFIEKKKKNRIPVKYKFLHQFKQKTCGSQVIVLPHGCRRCWVQTQLVLMLTCFHYIQQTAPSANIQCESHGGTSDYHMFFCAQACGRGMGSNPTQLRALNYLFQQQQQHRITVK